MSVLRREGYGDGRTEGRMADSYLGPEEYYDGLPTGIWIQGHVDQLAGQPPLAVHGDWGYLGWAYYPKAGIGL